MAGYTAAVSPPLRRSNLLPLGCFPPTCRLPGKGLVMGALCGAQIIA